MSKQSKMIDKCYRDGFDKGYRLGIMEGYSEGRFAATMRVVELNCKGK